MAKVTQEILTAAAVAAGLDPGRVRVCHVGLHHPYEPGSRLYIGSLPYIVLDSVNSLLRCYPDVWT